MKTTKNKSIKIAYADYQKSTKTNLYHCYNSFSDKKEKAWKHCQDLVKYYQGENLKVVYFNGWIFTCGFICYINGLKHFIYITPYREEALPLEEIIKETGEVLTLNYN